jgi:hypothetical protein
VVADQLLLFLAWSGAALLLVGTTVLMAGIGFHIESRWREKIAEWLVPTLIVAMIASTLFSSRDLSPLLLDYSSPRKGIGQVGENILRILTVIVVGFAFLQMIGIRFARQRLMGNQGIMIFGAFAAYLLSNSIVNSILGTRPSFDASFLYSLILVAALFCARHVVRIDALAKAAMASILVALILSLVLAILDPKLAFEMGAGPRWQAVGRRFESEQHCPSCLNISDTKL